MNILYTPLQQKVVKSGGEEGGTKKKKACDQRPVCPLSLHAQPSESQQSAAFNTPTHHHQHHPLRKV